ncbi:MAG: hypothetical protein FWF63_00700 [Fibromonadales bacterium]|nr:hypothetical protein [Fibromonadales bacterium]
MSKKLDITDEAMVLLEANKSEGYSFKRLASEAIIEKYGKPKNSAGPVQGHDGPLRHPPSHYLFNVEPSAEDWAEAVRLLNENGGNQALAVRATNDSKPNCENVVKAINEICKISAGGGV